jgi:hypothetical protein
MPTGSTTTSNVTRAVKASFSTADP